MRVAVARFGQPGMEFVSSELREEFDAELKQFAERVAALATKVSFFQRSPAIAQCADEVQRVFSESKHFSQRPQTLQK